MQFVMLSVLLTDYPCNCLTPKLVPSACVLALAGYAKCCALMPKP
jgi:hypothetical protein